LGIGFVSKKNRRFLFNSHLIRDLLLFTKTIGQICSSARKSAYIAD